MNSPHVIFGFLLKAVYEGKLLAELNEPPLPQAGKYCQCWSLYTFINLQCWHPIYSRQTSNFVGGPHKGAIITAVSCQYSGSLQ